MGWAGHEVGQLGLSVQPLRGGRHCISAQLLVCWLLYWRLALSWQCPPPTDLHRPRLAPPTFLAAGPLEATIANLQREIAASTAEGRELQRRWIVVQGQLVGLQADNAVLASELGQLRNQQAVMQVRQVRLRRALEGQQAEARALAKALAGLHAEMVRLNGQLAEATGLRNALSEGTSLLEAAIGGELRALEAQWAALQSGIEELRGDKGEALAALVEAEQEVLVWERRVQLEREMQDAIDPQYGSAEVQALRKEVARLQHRQASLLRRQEGLVGEMERAVAKREVIGTRGRAAAAPRVQAAAEAQLRKQQAELERGAAAADREARMAAARVVEVERELVKVARVAEAARQSCGLLQQAGEEVRAQVEALAADKYQVRGRARRVRGGGFQTGSASLGNAGTARHAAAVCAHVAAVCEHALQAAQHC